MIQVAAAFQQQAAAQTAMQQVPAAAAGASSAEAVQLVGPVGTSHAGPPAEHVPAVGQTGVLSLPGPSIQAQ